MSTFLKSAFAKVQDTATHLLYGIEKKTAKMTFCSTVDKDITGKERSMAEFKGNVLLIVNVASKWGHTKSNYTELPKLVDENGARGFKVLAFPCNQFGGQEPGTHEEIIEFVKQYDEHMSEKLTFFEKSDVNGANAREPFSFLKQACPNDDGTTDIRWNFGKFKIGLRLYLFVPRDIWF
jgi:glutathione peroxidase-family protein